ncbi:MAG: class I SAM-dependent methyltransferase [Pseudomonadota bacterium]
MSLTRLNHSLIRQHFAKHPEALGMAVDATCGNGFDTLFLAELGFRKVVGFDIQTAAIDATRQRLHSAGHEEVPLYQQGHQELTTIIQQEVDCVMFNFGYLPGADKGITTLAESSVVAVQQATDLLSHAGVISLMCYPGHAAGAEEKQLIEAWLNNLQDDPCWRMETHLSATPSNTAPILFLLQRTVSEE